MCRCILHKTVIQILSSSRTIIDTYDLYGNRLNRKDISCPDDKNILNVYSIRSDPKGTALDAVVVYLGVGDGGPMFTCIDPETGKMTNVKSLYGKKAKKIIRNDASISDVSFIGEYTVVKMMCTSPSNPDMDWQLLAVIFNYSLWIQSIIFKLRCGIILNTRFYSFISSKTIFR